jgi:hypothetical protein
MYEESRNFVYFFRDLMPISILIQKLRVRLKIETTLSAKITYFPTVFVS